MQETEGRGGEREAVGECERRDRGDKFFPAFDQQHEREDEEQVVDAEEDVLETENQIGARHLPRRGGGGDDNRRFVRRGAQSLSDTVAVGDADECVHFGGGEAFDGNDLSSEATRTLESPAFDVCVVAEYPARLVDRFRIGGKAGVERQAHGVAARGHFPHHFVGAGFDFAEFEIGGTHLVRGSGQRDRAPQKQNGERAFHRSAVVFAGCSFGHSMVTSYCLSRVSRNFVFVSRRRAFSHSRRTCGRTSSSVARRPSVRCSTSTR